MPSVELIAVGTELLLGQLVDTNTAFIAQHLAEDGIDVHATHAVGDNRRADCRGDSFRACDAPRASLRPAASGPTVDDLTKEAVCDALDLGTELYEPALRQMEKLFASLGRDDAPEQPQTGRASAREPSAGKSKRNGARIHRLRTRRKVRRLHAGRAARDEADASRAGRAVLARTLRKRRRRSTRAFFIRSGLANPRSTIGSPIFFDASENPKIAVLAHDFRVDVKIMAKAGSRGGGGGADLAVADARSNGVWRGTFSGATTQTPASAIHALLQAQRTQASVAESCHRRTGRGGIDERPGASRSFVGGVVAYDNSVKIARARR